MIENELRLAVSGTYSTGKSTTTEILSIVTGIPRIHAMTAREILPDLIPGRRFKQLSASELLAVELRRLEELIHHEAAQPGSFVADGSVIQEWINGVARMRVGVNAGASLPARLVRGVTGLSYRKFYRQYMDAYGMVVKARAKRSYDGYIHLPVEFPLASDGHCPVSEQLRKVSDELFVQTLRELEIPYLVISGTIRDRIEKIIDIFGLPLKMSVDEAINLGQDRVRKAARLMEADTCAGAVQRSNSGLRRISYALR